MLAQFGAALAGPALAGPVPAGPVLAGAVPLSVASPDCAAAFFGERGPRCASVRKAGSLAGLREVLQDAARGPARPVTLDLIGHSTREHRLLRLGTTPVSMLDPAAAAFFAGLAGSGVLARLGVTAVRLLGCETAVSDAGQRTMRMLARLLGVPVYGALVPLAKYHWNAAGFDPAFGHLLAGAAELPAS